MQEKIQLYFHPFLFYFFGFICMIQDKTKNIHFSYILCFYLVLLLELFNLQSNIQFCTIELCFNCVLIFINKRAPILCFPINSDCTQNTSIFQYVECIFYQYYMFFGVLQILITIMHEVFTNIL
jgi:hypothetical protein